ncbi:MAG: HlyD family efflux transporter periplasmic adaptor subunit [bacterium]
MNAYKALFLLFIFSAIYSCARENGIGSYTFSGTVEMTEYSVGAPVPGRIAEIFVEEGREMRKGELIAILDHYEQAKRDFERSEALKSSGGVSAQQYEHDRLAMEDQRVSAPVDGVVLVKVREKGEVVNAGSPIVVFGEQGQLWVRVFVPEILISQVSMNKKAKVTVDGYKESFSGYVSYISTSAEFTPRNVQTREERISQTFAVKIVINAGAMNLKPGIGADVVFEASK